VQPVCYRLFVAANEADTMARRPLVAGNWKMNGFQASTGTLAKIVAGSRGLAAVDLMVCPPATLVAGFAAAARGSAVAIGGQDCATEPAGAFTGDISAEMLKDAGASAVIVGHSERRQYHGETDAAVRAKVLAAHRASLTAIVCIGETQAERDAGRALAVVGAQLDGSLPNGTQNGRDIGRDIILAYEPVWAIGTGKTPTTADVGEMHGFIRKWLVSRFGEAAGQGIRILYGGSVKPANAKQLMAVGNVDGALVGGASLLAEEFLAIAGVYG
jgi:triosephosphate isomerase (TIM)